MLVYLYIKLVYLNLSDFFYLYKMFVTVVTAYTCRKFNTGLANKGSKWSSFVHG